MAVEIERAHRPAIEALEGRIVATASLHSAASHGQAWVEIANQTGRNLSYQISFNDGQTYSTVQVPKGGASYAHVTRTDPDFLIKLKGESPTVLATGPSKQAAPIFTITRTDSGGTSMVPAPVSGGGGSTSVGIGGGVNTSVGSQVGGTDTLPQAYVVLLNQSGEDVTLAFTNNDGRNYLDLTIGQQYFSLFNPFIVSLDQTRDGIKIQNPNGRGLLSLGSSPTLNSAPVYIINASLDIFPS